jgi:hypothetical protein
MIPLRGEKNARIAPNTSIKFQVFPINIAPAINGKIKEFSI